LVVYSEKLTNSLPALENIITKSINKEVIKPYMIALAYIKV